MKYLYILVAMVFMGCSDKSPMIEKVVEPVVKVESAQIETVKIETPKIEILKNEVKVVEAKKEVLRSNETMVDEPTVTKNIAADVPASCAMWSDGSNICNRLSTGKASCTTNPVENRMFSCLQWQ
jgi:hypothetical protein